ncbi:hypothetical protein WA158_003944 [Blastocystis sp. Blastoise]
MVLFEIASKGLKGLYVNDLWETLESNRELNIKLKKVIKQNIWHFIINNELIKINPIDDKNIEELNNIDEKNCCLYIYENVCYELLGLPKDYDIFVNDKIKSILICISSSRYDGILSTTLCDQLSINAKRFYYDIDKQSQYEKVSNNIKYYLNNISTHRSTIHSYVESIEDLCDTLYTTVSSCIGYCVQFSIFFSDIGITGNTMVSLDRVIYLKDDENDTLCDMKEEALAQISFNYDTFKYNFTQYIPNNALQYYLIDSSPMTINQLCYLFNISPKTFQRKLTSLEKNNIYSTYIDSKGKQGVKMIYPQDYYLVHHKIPLNDYYMYIQSDNMNYYYAPSLQNQILSSFSSLSDKKTILEMTHRGFKDINNIDESNEETEPLTGSISNSIKRTDKSIYKNKRKISDHSIYDNDNKYDISKQNECISINNKEYNKNEDIDDNSSDSDYEYILDSIVENNTLNKKETINNIIDSPTKDIGSIYMDLHSNTSECTTTMEILNDNNNIPTKNDNNNEIMSQNDNNEEIQSKTDKSKNNNENSCLVIKDPLSSSSSLLPSPSLAPIAPSNSITTDNNLFTIPTLSISTTTDLLKR